MADTPYFSVEYTQSIQTFKNGIIIPPPGIAPDVRVPNNSIPLISHKQTLARVYLNVKDIYDINLGQRTFKGEIGFFVPGGFIRIESFNGRIPAKKSFQISRANINDTLNFLIPSEYCKGVVNGIFTIEDNFSQDGPLGYLFKLEFTDIPLLEIHSVLIHYNGVDYGGNPVDKQASPYDLMASLDYVLRSYPINGFAFDGCEVLDWTMSPTEGQTAPDAVEQSWYDLFATLKDMHESSGSDSIYLGVLPEEASCAGTCGLGEDNIAALFRARETENAAHEIGHAMGRPHTPCINAAGDQDESYPDYWGLPRGTIGEYGVDLKILGGPVGTQPNAIQDPHKVCDFLSYCPPRWISPHTYLEILYAAQSRGSQFFSLKISTEISLHREYQFISFRLHETAGKQRLEIRNEFCISRNHPPRSGEFSELVIDVIDNKDNLLFSSPCTGNSSSANPLLAFKDFSVWVPLMNDTHRFRIRKKNEVIYEQAVSKVCPEITSFNSRKIEKKGTTLIYIDWKGKGGSESSCIRYTVRFTHDGKKWRSLVCGSRADSIVVNADTLPGGDHCTIQLMASSGFRTTTKKIENISLPIKPRKIFINTPGNNEQFAAGEMIYFSGVGFSPDFGINSREEINWYTASKGLIGKGYQLMYNGLPEGEHVIILQAGDGLGKEITEEVTIMVCRQQKTETGVEEQNRSISDLVCNEKIQIQKHESTNYQDEFLLQKNHRSPVPVAGTGCRCHKH